MLYTSSRQHLLPLPTPHNIQVHSIFVVPRQHIVVLSISGTCIRVPLHLSATSFADDGAEEFPPYVESRLSRQS